MTVLQFKENPYAHLYQERDHDIVEIGQSPRGTASQVAGR